MGASLLALAKSIYYTCSHVIMASISEAYRNSPRDIHFWVYDDVTHNCILDSKKNQYSQRFYVAIILVPFIYSLRPRVLFKGTSAEHVKQKKGASLQRRERSA